MNIVFYGRYSDAGQSEQSIEGQRKTCYEWAERNGYRIIAEYIDRALSGTEVDNRPEFQRMIADSAKRQFQGVLVYQLDRFARNRYDSATHKNKLKKNGVKVLSARENMLAARKFAQYDEYYKLKDDVKYVEVLRRGAEDRISEVAPERMSVTRVRGLEL